jgi:hypothetical protein
VLVAVYLEPALAAQHDVKDRASRKIDVQAPGRAQFSAAKNHGFQRDGAQDLGDKILRGELGEQPNAGAFHGRLDKNSSSGVKDTL